MHHLTSGYTDGSFFQHRFSVSYEESREKQLELNSKRLVSCFTIIFNKIINIMNSYLMWISSYLIYKVKFNDLTNYRTLYQSWASRKDDPSKNVDKAISKITECCKSKNKNNRW
jgi:hypothetical protein